MYILELYLAVSAETTISAKKFSLLKGSEMLKAKTSVGIFFLRYVWLSFFIKESVTMDTVISPLALIRSSFRILLIRFFIIKEEIKFLSCRFFTVIFSIKK